MADYYACAPVPSAFRKPLIEDDFEDGILDSNPNGVGGGFVSINANGSAGWMEAESGISHVGGTTSAAPTARLTSVDTFVANSASADGIITTTFVLSNWERTIDTTNFNGRFALGITVPSAVPIDSAPNSQDGLWLLMNFDSNGLLAGQGGLSYVNSGTKTRLGDSWAWDDNGIDIEGATAVEMMTSDINTAREDRIDIDMIASDISITMAIGANFWSVDFSSNDPSVVLPPFQSGTFSEAGLDNDLSEAVISIYHQGDNLHTATFDRITVVEGAPTPQSLDLTIVPFDEGFLLEWNSQPSLFYTIYSSEDLRDDLSIWDIVEANLEAEDGSTTQFFNAPSQDGLFYRVAQTTPTEPN